jgi:hypothetical protein
MEIYLLTLQRHMSVGFNICPSGRRRIFCSKERYICLSASKNLTVYLSGLRCCCLVRDVVVGFEMLLSGLECYVKIKVSLSGSIHISQSCICSFKESLEHSKADYLSPE